MGNPPGAPALEMTLTGAEIEFGVPCEIALSGAEIASDLDGTGVPALTTIGIKPGQILKCGHVTRGLRTYLCVRGGIEVPLLFGSASTHLMTGMGGFRGRALRRDDQIAVGRPSSDEPIPRMKVRPEIAGFLSDNHILRVTPGPQAELVPAETLSVLTSSEYEVSRDSDRMGLRLKGPSLPIGGVEILTEGVSLGAVQITPAGDPIILFVDHQTTGGYPKIANVISADLHNVAQRRPGDRIEFKLVSVEQARTILAEQESMLKQRAFIPA